MTPEHLIRQVERLCELRPDTRIVGIHAARWQGPDDIVVNGQTFPVRWCDSALAVSEGLADIDVDDRLIVLTPLANEALGLDVRARLARRRLLHPELWQTVRDAYGVVAVDPRLPTEPWMAEALLRARPRRRGLKTSVLDSDTAWTHVLDHHLELPHGPTDPTSIIRWSMKPSAVERFAALPAPLAEAVARRFEETAGGLGTLLASGITTGHADDLLPIGLVCEVLFGDENDELSPGLVQAAARLEPLLGGATVEPGSGREWAAAAQRVLRTLSRDERDEWLGHAERMLSNLKAETFAERSSVLPSGSRSRLGRFAAAALSAIDAPDVLESVERAFRHVLEHAACANQGERIFHMEMALRLVRSLHRAPVAANAPADLITHHATEGAFEDWARRHLLGGDEHPDVAALFGAVHRAVRNRREGRNRTFAEGVRDWLARTDGQEVVPIERCLARTVVPLGRSRPVLVLVLDGMDAGIFEELCEDLNERGWRRQRGPAPAAVLAVLPTVTESSRMALMTGRVGRGNAAAEKAGFARHRELRGASLPGRPPLLFHKGDLTGDAAEGLAAPVRDALRDGRQRIVGIVLNAVDDHLAKSEQLHLSWRVESVRLLPTILTEAHAAGRTIVLTSDHGHVLEADGVKLTGDAEGRWRNATSPATELEIEIAGARVLAATGRKRIVVPWSETVRYGSKRNGYHGGASLQEAVVPVGVFVGPGEQLDGWEPVARAYPPWWHAESIGPSRTDQPASAEPSAP